MGLLQVHAKLVRWASTPTSTHPHVDVCAFVMQGEASRNRRVLVFCNTVDSCRAVEHHCRERGLPTVCYHGTMPIPARKEAFNEFLGAWLRGHVGWG